MIPLKADPSAIATRMKVGIEAETWVLSDSGTFAMIRLLTKLQDIPKPVPIITESMPIAQSGPTGITNTRATVVILISKAPECNILGRFHAAGFRKSGIVGNDSAECRA